MAEFKLERFKYNWRGVWVADTAYKRDDVVRVNGKSYVCIVTHVASLDFRTDLTAILPDSVPPQSQPRWTVMTSGSSFIGDWIPGSNYNLGDVVKYNGSLWTCTISHASSNFVIDFANWEVLAQATGFIGNWTSGNAYAPGAVVKYNGMSYKCIVAHIASSTLETNIDFWEVYLESAEIRNDWQPNTEYRLNDLVKYGGTIFRCIETNSGASNFENDKFQVEVYGFQNEGIWNDVQGYNIGDIVRHEGFVYYAITNNYYSRPYADNGSPDWILISRSYNFKGDWEANNIYKTGDVTLRGGNLFLALRDIADGQAVDGSTLDYLQDDTWELLVPGKAFKGNFTIGTNYSVGDVVYYRGSSYVCNFQHIASTVTFPGDNGSGYNFWDILIQSVNQGGLTTRGDLLTYGLSRQIDNDGSTVFDDSSFGDTRLAIGETEQLLSVSADLEVFWRDITQDADAVYVATNGIDDDNRGTSEKPFRTIRHAAEYVEDTFSALTPVVIRVSTGKFEEIGPIIVPAGCAINGDELRSTTVLASPAIASYQNNYPYVQSYLNEFINIIGDVATGTLITPTAGNTVSQINSIIQNIIAPDVPQIDIVTGLPVAVPTETFPQGNILKVNNIIARFDDFKNFIEFRISNGIIDPVLEGSNVRNNDQEDINTIEAVYINRNFVAAELIARLKLEYPNVIFDEMQLKNDIRSLIRGLRRDGTYSGNYGTLTAARRYVNAVNGSQLDNLFLLRDSTGVRDLTTGGLRGVLNPPGVFELYQKPTGGACVSLDPGWGPDDTRTWIINRSPYIQGVTNTGSGCVGKKVDGSLHNGGNRSMTSNDFTQVLSDGIGVWVSNNARAELVSVFTYYCQVGYFAEDGGIIRAANGNNSYGRYGAIADGVDDTETPQAATVFNRNNQASVIEAFAGGATDELLLFEFSNTGEQYTNATASITGAGANASVEFTDFRDGALFEARLTSPDGSSNKGGAGYIVRQGNAQETLGASSTIKISTNDTTQFLSEIEGMRIIITDGTGVGQYGYISDFEFVGKIVTVTKDSDNTLGWDHIIPGTPIVTDLDPTTRYRIEPRISITHPGFSDALYPLFTNRSYVDVVYGNTTEVYTNVTASSNLLWRDDSLSRIVVSEIISNIALQFTANLVNTPEVPFNIKGKTSGTTATVTAISANTGEIIEADISGSGNSFIVGEEIDLVFAAGSGNTFDDAPVPAVFSVSRSGETYAVSLTTAGAGYNDGDVLTILGTALGGTAPDNNLTITVTSVSLDSTASIQTFTSTGTGRKGKFVSLTNSEYSRYSEDGVNWTETSLSFIADYRKLISGNNRFIALANGQSRVSSSLNGQIWTTVNLPLLASWTDGTYGGGKFVLVADDNNEVAVSTNGTTWTTATIPDDAGGADSTISQWKNVSYGKGRFVAVSANDLATATSTDGGVTWTRNDEVLPNEDWSVSSLVYGNNRFLLVSVDGTTAYSFDGVTWYSANPLEIVAGFEVTKVKYAQGVFLAIGLYLGATNLCATSEDGLIWTTRTLSASQQWTALTHGNIDGIGTWVLLATAASINGICHIETGARAKCRAEVLTGIFQNIKIWDSGSGYSGTNLPILTITDPNFTSEVAYESRIGNGVLSQPDFINRGSGYRSTTSTIRLSGNGYADIIPEENIITLSGVKTIPSPGVQLEIAGVLNVTTDVPDDLFIFSGVIVQDLGDDGTGNETRLVQLTISPSLETYLNVIHGTSVTLREKFSQCRISGHDFLDIGTGNFEETNYPTLYASGAFFVASPENEIYESNSGRVFYVSTDQDGNFRAGELFSVQQATGVVTISAQFFNLDGLSQLALGGVRLGGSGTVISEFSTDGTFSADSNNIIPTQRAIATFLASRLSVGGESLEVNRLQAGRVILGGADTELTTIAGYLNMPSDVNFDGVFTSDDGAGNITTSQTNISGTIIGQMLILKKFDDNMQ
jgi:hypothetical protein